MEAMEGSGRWPSYADRENDRINRNHEGNYPPYETEARQSGRSGRFVDVGQSSRILEDRNALNVDERTARRKRMAPSAIAHHAVRKEGPNWILIAGGAIVTAIGVMIVRRQKPAAVQKSALVNISPMAGKDRARQSGISLATTRQESTGSRTSELSSDSPYSADPYGETQTQAPSEGSRVGSDWGDDECHPLSPPISYCSQIPRASSISNRTVISPTSPPGSYRGGDTSATECNDPIVLSPPSRLNFSTRRDVVHRLRQQLKSRDEMILDMQAQISDQEQTIGVQKAQCRDLENRLEDTCRTLFESNLEVQRLRKAVADYLGGHVSSASLASSAADGRVSAAHQRLDENFLVREAGRLAEELRLREEEKQELEQIVRIKIKEHDLVVQRVKVLEAELEEARKDDLGKDLLLEAYEVEQEDFEVKLDSLKRLMENKQSERSPAPSKIGRKSFSGGFGVMRLGTGQGDEIEENGRIKADDFRVQARKLVRSYSALFERNPEQSNMECNNNSVARQKTEESSSNGDVTDESEAEGSSPPLSEKLVRKLRQEVEQLSVMLADHSDMMSKKRLETTRLMDEFQRHNSVIDDMQEKLDQDAEGSPESPDQVWQNHFQYLSFSNGATSASQIQELGHKLEQIANQQRVEEEIADLSKHQVKISELKQRVEKLLIRCKKQSNGGFSATAHQQASKMAAAGFELAKQLELQEEQAKRTSREVQKLLASFELSSPYVPRSKKEELRRMLQACSSESFSPPETLHPRDLLDMSYGESLRSAGFANGSEGKPKESDDVLFDPAVSSSAEPAASLQDDDCQTLHTPEQYVYRSGMSGPSMRKPRRVSSSNSRKERSSDSRRRPSRTANTSPIALDNENVSSNSRGSVDGVLDVSSPPIHEVELPCATGEEDQAFQAMQRSQDDALSMTLGPAMDKSAELTVSGSTKSSDGASDSSKVTRRSTGRHNVTSESSVESTKGSFGKFLFDIETGDGDEKGDGVYSINQQQDDSRQKIDLPGTATLLLPTFTGTTRSESNFLKDQTRDPGLDAVTSGSLNNEGRDRRASRSTTSGSSIDSSFDALLSNTLDDLVRVCSTPPNT